MKIQTLIPHNYPSAKFGVIQIDETLHLLTPCCGAIVTGIVQVTCDSCLKEYEIATLYFGGRDHPVVITRGLNVSNETAAEWVRAWTGLDVEVSIK